MGLFLSFKNRYGLLPFVFEAEGNPVPNALTVRYLIDLIMLGKIMNGLLDVPRLKRVTIIPRGVPKTNQYELAATLGG